MGARLAGDGPAHAASPCRSPRSPLLRASCQTSCSPQPQAQLAKRDLEASEAEVARLRREHAAALEALGAAARGHAAAAGAGAAGAAAGGGNPLLGLPAGVGAPQVGAWIREFLLQDSRWAGAGLMGRFWGGGVVARPCCCCCRMPGGRGTGRGRGQADESLLRGDVVALPCRSLCCACPHACPSTYPCHALTHIARPPACRRVPPDVRALAGVHHEMARAQVGVPGAHSTAADGSSSAAPAPCTFSRALSGDWQALHAAAALNETAAFSAFSPWPPQEAAGKRPMKHLLQRLKLDPSQWASAEVGAAAATCRCRCRCCCHCCCHLALPLPLLPPAAAAAAAAAATCRCCHLPLPLPLPLPLQLGPNVLAAATAAAREPRILLTRTCAGRRW